MRYPSAKTSGASRTRKSPPRASRPARRHNAVQVSPASVGERITHNIQDAFTLATVTMGSILPDEVNIQ